MYSYMYCVCDVIPLCILIICMCVQAYFFEDDSDDQSGSDVSPLVRRPPSQSSSNTPHSHIFTGYISAIELLLLVS